MDLKQAISVLSNNLIIQTRGWSVEDWVEQLSRWAGGEDYWKVEWANAKDRISRLVYNVREEVRDILRDRQQTYNKEVKQEMDDLNLTWQQAMGYKPKYKDPVLALLDKFPDYPHQIPGFVAKLDKAKAKMGGEPEFQKIYDIANGFLEVSQLLKDTKAGAKSGRKPSTDPAKQKKTFQSSPASKKLVEEALRQIVAETVENVRSSVTERYKNWALEADEWISSGEGKNVYDWGKKNKKRDAVQAVRSMFDTGYSMRDPDVLKDNYEDIAAALADDYVEQMIAFYLEKNIKKIAPIVTMKGVPSEVTPRGALDGWGFSGEIDFDFPDGTAFTVRNKVIVKMTQWGNLFNQFPTTFHQVIFPDGTKKKMVPEETMNKEWANA